ncbi:hypothetical protein H9P43_003476 [Blastocladiella emersonii ATCC 22665]|nr:hypothetical protein H9P43_003476 [Blastocladiella emersonii ATCC 22665]
MRTHAQPTRKRDPTTLLVILAVAALVFLAVHTVTKGAPVLNGGGDAPAAIVSETGCATTTGGATRPPPPTRLYPPPAPNRVPVDHHSGVPASSGPPAAPPSPPPPAAAAPPAAGAPPGSAAPSIEGADVYRRALSLRDAHLAASANSSTSHPAGIPGMVHSIWLGGSPPATAFTCHAQWSSLNDGTLPTLMWRDADADALVREHFPHLASLYAALPKPVMRADWLRLMILAVVGGVYADIDACPLKPVRAWPAGTVPGGANATAGLVVGVETDTTRADWADWYSRQFQLCSWTVAAAPGHPAVAAMLHATARKVRATFREGGGRWPADITKRIVELTGPAVVTDEVLRYAGTFGDTRFETMHMMNEPRWFDDVAILPITAFSPGIGHMGAREIGDPEALVQHLFYGTWKGN